MCLPQTPTPPSLIHSPLSPSQPFCHSNHFAHLLLPLFSAIHYLHPSPTPDSHPHHSSLLLPFTLILPYQMQSTFFSLEVCTSSPFTLSSNEFQIPADIHSFVHHIRQHALFHNIPLAPNEVSYITDSGYQPSHWIPASAQFQSAVDHLASTCQHVAPSLTFPGVPSTPERHHHKTG